MPEIKEMKWSSVFFLSAFHLPSAWKYFIISPWKMALSGAADKWTASVVLIILAYIFFSAGTKPNLKHNIQSSTYKGMWGEAHHHF